MIKLIENWVSAWFSSFVWDDENYEISLENYLIEHPKSSICVRIKWKSMINAWILTWDIAIVDSSIIPQNWNIVIAIIDGIYTIKTFLKDLEWKVFLRAANDEYSDFYPEESLSIFWVVVGIIRKY